MSGPSIEGMLDRTTGRPASVYTPPEDLIRAEPPMRRTARVAIDSRELARFADLPVGCDVIAIETTNDPVSVVLIVRSDDFPEVPHEAQSPYAHRTVEVVHVDGRAISRTVDLKVWGGETRG